MNKVLEVSPLSRYFSTFEFILIDYLAARIARYNKVEPKILLSTRLSDQMLQHKINISQYELNLNQVLKNLGERTEKLFIIYATSSPTNGIVYNLSFMHR